MSRNSVLEVTILGWKKHNAAKQKNHRHFMLEDRFFDDSKISQLSKDELLVYMRLLTIAAENACETVTIHSQMLPKRWRIGERSLKNHVESLKQIQLVSYCSFNNINKINIIREAQVPADVVLENQELEETENPPEQILMEVWNDYCGNLDKVKFMGAARKRHAANRWKDKPDVDYWIDIIHYLATTPWYNGSGGRGWKANFDFVMGKKEKHLEIYEKIENLKEHGKFQSPGAK